MKKNRREFLANGASVAATGWAWTHTSPARGADSKNDLTPADTRTGDMIYRTLGRTGEKVSLIGLGGAHIGGQRDEAESIRIIRTAVDRGITFMDNCWDYNGGQSEVRMGNALRDGYREKVFLMTKIDGRTKAAAAKQIDESLQRLRTDRLDLLQIHEVIRLEDPDRIFAEGGAWEAVEDAKKAGKIRYIGFTGHKDPLVHLRMLDAARKRGARLDAVQMPVNVMDASFRSFQNDVLPRLVKSGIGALAMKPFGGGPVLRHVMEQKLAAPTELLHYAMTLPVSVVITGIDRMEILDQAVEAAKTFRPLTAARMSDLRQKTKVAAAEGRHELFKTTSVFDGTAHNPQWLG